MLAFYIRILGRDLIKHLMKEPVSEFHNIIFRHAGDLFTVISAGILKSIPYNAFTTGTRNQLKTLNDLRCLLVFYACVKILFVLANYYHIHTGVRYRHKRVVSDRRTHIGIK